MPASDAASVVIACPHCGTRYQVPYQAIGPKGRNVGCAHCGQSWEAHAERPKAPPRQEPPAPPPPPAKALGEIAEEVLDEQFVIEEKRHKAKREAAARADAEAKAAHARADAELRAKAAALVDADIKAEAATRAEAIAKATAAAAGPAPAAPGPSAAAAGDDEETARAAAHQRTLDEIKAAIAPKPRKGEEPSEQLDPAARKRQLQEFSARQRHLYSKLPIARLRRAARIAAALILIVLLGGSIMWRGPIVMQFPQLAGLYAAVGLGVNVVGLEFRDVRTLQTLQQGTEVLSVDGSIASAAGHEVTVPQVIVTLLGARGTPLYEWSMVPKATELEPGESIAFETQLTNPPAGAKDIRLSFATARTQSRTFEAPAGPVPPGGTTPAPAEMQPKFEKPEAGASPASDNPKDH